MLQRKGFPQIIKDNEETYFKYLDGVISSVDEDAQTECTKKDVGISIRISPSEPDHFNIILQQIKKLHTLLSLQVEFSKSMKAGGNIYFCINF